MTKKPVIISAIATALSYAAKVLGGQLSGYISALSLKITGTAPVNSGGISGNVIYFFKNIGYKARCGAATVTTAPLKGVNAIFNLLGNLFIPLLIVTIVLLVITILMSVAKKRRIQKRREVKERIVETGKDAVDTGLSAVFNQLR